MTTWVAAAGAVFMSVDWFVPPYFQGGALRRLAASVEAAAPDRRHAVLAQELPRLYTIHHLAAMLLGRYTSVPHVRDFGLQIREAIEASMLGLRHAAITTLLTAIEGTLRSYAAANGRDIGSGTRRLIDEMSTMALSQRAVIQKDSDEALIERAEMTEQLRDFLRERLLVNTNTYAGIGNLNRHGILHGIFHDYDADGNFEKLISFLDGLVFYFTLTTSGISLFAPELTTESRRLAAYLGLLKEIGQHRPTAG